MFVSRPRLGVFISYRRNDAAGTAGRIGDRLEAHRDFKGARLFRDVSIEPGADFEDTISYELDKCTVMLAIIGQSWLGGTNAKRLQDDNDFVRVEVGTAIESDLETIPVLVDGASMPTADALPSVLRPLVDNKEFRLNNARIDRDIERLVKRLLKLPAPGSRTIGPKRSARDGLTYEWIPSGTFTMGGLPDDAEASTDEKPAHVIEMKKAFYLSQTPVTVAAYERFTRANGVDMPLPPIFNKGWRQRDHPIVRVSWDEARAYCDWAGGRLPTEAEWEYAARGGREGLVYPMGKTINHDKAKYHKRGRHLDLYTATADAYPPNGFGLFNIAGNVSEWVMDRYDPDGYQPTRSLSGRSDPTTDRRVTRGGSWRDGYRELRVSNRVPFDPDARSRAVGFRCALDQPPPRPLMGETRQPPLR